MTKFIAIVFSLVLMTSSIAFAQQIEPIPAQQTNPNVNIIFPPPVYVLQGAVDIYGTVNVDGLINYFLEVRPLDFDGTASPDRPWFPIVLPRSDSITTDVLGTWTTTTLPDGVYELRLVANSAAGTQVFRVSPIRLLNSPLLSPDNSILPTLALNFVKTPVFPTQDLRVVPTVESTPIPGTTPVIASPATPIPAIRIRPTLQPTPTQLGGFSAPAVQSAVTATTVITGPRVTAVTNANVRRGDSLNYEIIGNLRNGEYAPILGVSSSGTGWYYIELPNGRRGFIAPSVAIAEGNLSNLPAVAPPPPPVPTATPTPTSQVNIAPIFIQVSPDPPNCGESFEIQVTIQNNGNLATSSGGFIRVQAVLASTGQQLGVTDTVFPALDQGEQHTSQAFLTIDTFKNEPQRIIVTVDSTNQITESNEGDNQLAKDYVLEPGTCP